MKHIEKGTFFINSEAETRALGLALAEAAEPGDIVALIGDLGTGKTALTKYIAEGLGVKEEVISPTFTIVREYRSGRLPLYHFDVYRLSDGMEFLDTEERFYDVGFARGQHKTLCTRCTLYTIFENYSADEIIDKFKDGTIEEITNET